MKQALENGSLVFACCFVSLRCGLCVMCCHSDVAWFCLVIEMLSLSSCFCGISRLSRCVVQKHGLVSAMPNNPKRVLRKDTCVTVSGASDRIESSLGKWQKRLPLPGDANESWLVRLEAGHFQCKCCRDQQAKFQFPSARTCTLSSADSTRPSKWTRLQAFRPHHDSAQHKTNAIIFIRETMPDIGEKDVASPGNDFLHL